MGCGASETVALKNNTEALDLFPLVSIYIILAFLRKIGIPEEKREAAQRDIIRETMYVSRDGEHWVFRITSPVGSRENRFKIGEEYEVKTSFANFKVCSSTVLHIYVRGFSFTTFGTLLIFYFFLHPKAIPRFEGAGEKKVVQKLKHPRTNEVVGTAINEVKENTMYMVKFSYYLKIFHNFSFTTATLWQQG